ncbi:hypothetical protein JHK82_043295 [Glycine max]|nr:hypothetical protein JHK82_043295 [Glycine max]
MERLVVAVDAVVISWRQRSFSSLAASFLVAFLLTWASEDAVAAAARFWESEDDIILAWECGFCERFFLSRSCIVDLVTWGSAFLRGRHGSCIVELRLFALEKTRRRVRHRNQTHGGFKVYEPLKKRKLYEPLPVPPPSLPLESEATPPSPQTLPTPSTPPLSQEDILAKRRNKDEI